MSYPVIDFKVTDQTGLLSEGLCDLWSLTHVSSYPDVVNDK